MPYNPPNRRIFDEPDFLEDIFEDDEEIWVDADEVEEYPSCSVCSVAVMDDECPIVLTRTQATTHRRCCLCVRCVGCQGHIFERETMLNYMISLTNASINLARVSRALGCTVTPARGDLTTIADYINSQRVNVNNIRCHSCFRPVLGNEDFDSSQYEELAFDETVRKDGWIQRTGNQMMHWVIRERDDLHFWKGEDTPDMPGDVYIGVEIECERGGSRKLQDTVSKWESILQSDGSVSSGFEIATAPASGDKFVEMIHEITDAAKSAHGLVTQRCGLHVHIDCRDMTPEQLLLMTGLWCAFEHQFIAMMPPSRRGMNDSTSTHYCRPISPRWRAMQAVAKGTETVSQRLGFMIRRKFEPAVWSQAERYKAWNLAAMQKYSTIECRLHSGTLQPSKIIPWASIMASLKRAVKTLDVDELTAHLRQPLASRQLLQELVYSESGRQYIHDRQHTFKDHNSPEQLLSLLNPIGEYKEALRGRVGS